MNVKQIKDELNCLPAKLIEQAYVLDVVGRKLQLQWNDLLAYSFKGYRVSEDEDFIYFEINNYRIIMDKEEEE